MSSQALDVETFEVPVQVAQVSGQPASGARHWYESRWYRIAFGLCFAVIGVAKLCNGLVLLTGATKYGAVLKVNQADLYYTTAVSKADAQALGDYLVQEKFLDGRHLSVQLTKADQTLQVRFPVKPGFEKDEAYAASVGGAAEELSQKVFHGQPTEIDLCDSELKTLRAVPAAKPAK
jgi:hypothetical protein